MLIDKVTKEYDLLVKNRKNTEFAKRRRLENQSSNFETISSDTIDLQVDVVEEPSEPVIPTDAVELNLRSALK